MPCNNALLTGLIVTVDTLLAISVALLGPVDIHRVARTDPTRWIIAAKLVSVLS